MSEDTFEILGGFMLVFVVMAAIALIIPFLFYVIWYGDEE